MKLTKSKLKEIIRQELNERVTEKDKIGNITLIRYSNGRIVLNSSSGTIILKRDEARLLMDKLKGMTR